MLLFRSILGGLLPFLATGISLQGRPFAFSLESSASLACGRFEEFRSCGPNCPPTCDNLKETVCCEVTCVTGCFCVDGYILEKDPRTGPRNCIPINECPSPGVLSFELPSLTTSERVGNVNIKVVRLNGTYGPISVRYRVLSTEAPYAGLIGQLEFSNGEPFRIIELPIQDNNIRNPDLTVQLELFEPSKKTNIVHGVCILTIEDDDLTPGYLEPEKTQFSVPENVGSVRVPVHRRDGSDGRIRVKYRTVPDSASPDVDFTPQIGELVFEEGQIIDFITVNIVDDEIREAPEKFRIELFDIDYGSRLLNFRKRTSVLTADVTIVDNDMKPGILLLEKPSYTAYENGGTIELAVVRREGQDGQVRVRFQTIPQSAQVGQDFETQMGDLVFEEGELRKQIRIKIQDDNVREPEEIFEVRLLDPTPGPGTINFRGLGITPITTVTIIDDDMNAGVLELERGIYEVMEDVGVVRVNVVRTGGQDGRITVQYQTKSLTANENRDFVPVSGELVFEEGELRKSIEVRIQDDKEKEPLETLEVLLLNPIPGPGILKFRGFGSIEKAVIRIVDNDMTPGILVLEKDSFEVGESDGVIQIGVVRLDGVDGQIQVHYQTVPKTAAAGKDFESVSGDLVFEPGQTRKTIPIRILNDDIREPSKYFAIQLMDPIAGVGVINFRGLGQIPAAVITILDDDMRPGSFMLERPYYEIRESAGNIRIGVVRVGGNDGQILVKYRTVPKSAQMNQDFVPSEGELIFEEGQNRKDIIIQIVDDDIREPIKDFEVQLLDPSPGPGVINFRRFTSNPTSIVSIIDDDMRPGILQFERPSYEIFENVGTLTIRVVRLHGTDGEIRVKYRTVATNAVVNQDFVHSEGELIFNEREDKKDITIRIVDDDIREPTKAFQVQILDPEPGLGVINFRGLGPLTTTLVTINDNDMKPGSFMIKEPSYDIPERVGIIKIPVFRVGGSDGKILVRYRTVPKSAQANQDFVPSEGELVFEEGQTSNDITIQIIDDDLREPTEKLEVQLLDPTPAPGVINFEGFISNPTVVISIIDDDMKPGILNLEKTSYEVTESSRTVTIGVVRLDGSEGEIRVKYRTIAKTAQANQDFVYSEGELVFGEGENRKDITIQVIDDDVREMTKTFEVQLLDATPGFGVINFRRFTTNPTALVTILDDDMKPGTFKLERPSYEVFENDGTITIGVIRTDGTDGEISVKYKTIPKTAQFYKDFIPVEGELVFGEKQNRKDIVIKIVDDEVRESTKTFEVQLLDPKPGVGVINFRRFMSNPTAVISIRDNDMKAGIVQLEKHSYEVLESVGTFKVGVVRLEGTDGEIRVRCKTIASDAVVNQDFVFVDSELIFKEGENRKDITIQVIDDDVKEPSKTFEVRLMDPRPGQGVINFKGIGPVKATVITIIDDDMKPGALQLKEGIYQFFENVGTVQIPVVRVGGSDGQVRVFYRTAPKTALTGTDFVFSNGEIVFREGEAEKFIEIQILDDKVREETKSFVIELLNPQAAEGVVNFRGFGQRPMAEVYILDDDMAPGFLEIEQSSYEVPENTGQVQISVIRLDGKDGQIKVRYRTIARSAEAQTDFLPVEGELVFEDGEDRKFIVVQILNDNVRESAEVFDVQLSQPTAGQEVLNFRGLGSRFTAAVTIQDDDTTPGILEFDRTTYFVQENEGLMQVVVVRKDGSDGQIRCQYQTRPKSAVPGSDFAPVQGELVFEHGETTKVIPIQILEDSIRETTESFEIVLMELTQGRQRVLGQIQTTEVVISDNDLKPGFVEFEKTFYDVSERDGTLNVIVKRVDGTDGQIRVGYVTTPKTALPGFDFIPIQGELIFEDGEKSKALQIQIRDDNQKESMENFEIELVNPDTRLSFRNSGQKLKALVTINDDDWTLGFFEFEKVSYTVMENEETVNVKVIRLGGSDGQISVGYQTIPQTAQPSSDFQPISGQLVFDNGETEKIIQVPILNDGVREKTETFEIQLLDPTPPQGFPNFRGLGQKRSAVVTIFDDDGNPGFLELEEPTYVVSEGIRTLHVVVKRKGGSDGRVKCRYQTTAKTALAGIDFEPGTGELIFEDGETEKTIDIRIFNDMIKESIKSFEVQLLDPLPAPGIVNFRVIGSRMKTLITIADDDTNPGLVQMARPVYDFRETDGIVNIPVMRVNGSDGQIQVRYQTVSRTAKEGIDFRPLSGELIFQDGEIEKTIPLQILNDREKEPTESFEVRLLDPTPGPGVLNFGGLGFNTYSVIKILDDDMQHGFLQLGSLNYHSTEGSGKMSIKVVRVNGRDGTIRVRYQTVPQTAIPGIDYIHTSGELVFEDQQTEKEIFVQILDDRRKEDTKTFEVHLEDPVVEGEDVTFRALGGRSIALISIVDDDHPGKFEFRETRTSVHEGSGRVTLTILRTDGSDGFVSLQLRAIDGSARQEQDYRLRSTAINFSNGETEKTVDIVIIDDNIREGDEHFKVGLFDPSNSAIIGQKSIFEVIILDDDERPSIPASQGPFIYFPETSVTVPLESPVVYFNIRREGNDWEKLNLFMETLDGTARENVHYKKTKGNVTFELNDMELRMSANLIDNPNRAGKSFKLRLYDPERGVILRGREILTVILGGSNKSAESQISFHQRFETSVSSSSGRRTDSIKLADLSAGVSSANIQLPAIRTQGLPSSNLPLPGSGQSSFPALPPPQRQRRKPPQGQEDCEPGLIFKSCFFGCPEVCNLIADPICSKSCTPACVCPSGLILESLHSSKCVPRSQCPNSGGRGTGIVGGGGGLLGGGGGGLVGGLLGGGGGLNVGTSVGVSGSVRTGGIVSSGGGGGGSLLGGLGLLGGGGGGIKVGTNVGVSGGGRAGGIVSSGGGVKVGTSVGVGGGLVGGLLG
ncbi:adhesion G-protein coupled receptor V1-like [Argiope bruennichi]|uniref:adhesion G-protein coupled receptor V1-like n=1 Tax=Argiope bruennichi TaxID=94029 RepID=UPI00249513EE|nr:adhesion G-protein coupled receptor V1-like [Argiope bruennichi]